MQIIGLVIMSRMHIMARHYIVGILSGIESRVILRHRCAVPAFHLQVAALSL